MGFGRLFSGEVSPAIQSFNEEMDDLFKRMDERTLQGFLRRIDAHGKFSDAEKQLLLNDMRVARKAIEAVEDQQAQVQRRMKTAGERIASAFADGLKLGIQGAKFTEISDLLSKSLDELFFTTIADVVAKRQNFAAVGAVFQHLADRILEDNKVDAGEALQLQGLRAEAERRRQEGLKTARELAEAAGLDLKAFEPAAAKQPQQRAGGISLAIRTISQRTADDLSIILRGSQALQSQIENNTRRSADASESWLPHLEEIRDLLSARGNSPEIRFQDDGPRNMRDLILNRQRARGRVNN